MMPTTGSVMLLRFAQATAAAPTSTTGLRLPRASRTTRSSGTRPTPTSPGHGDGTAGWRQRTGLPGGGPSAIVTTLGVFRFPPEGGETFLASVHPGHTVGEVRAETGWDLQVSLDVGETPAPTEEELAQIRKFDPDGFWTRRG